MMVNMWMINKVEMEVSDGLKVIDMKECSIMVVRRDWDSIGSMMVVSTKGTTRKTKGKE